MSAWIKEKTPWPRRSVRRGVAWVRRRRREEEEKRKETHTKQKEKVV